MVEFNKQNFLLGCNYWASHAGIDMWRNWRPEIIEKDFAKLAELKIKVIRIFPIWSEFQPLTRHARNFNQPYQLRWRDGAEIPVDEDGRQSGVDPEMLSRFRFVCDCAHKYGFELGVGLVTGWMSGKVFAPPAFESLNLLCDPLVIFWQMKFVKRFVNEFKSHPAIAFWGVGNEINCLSKADRYDGAAWVTAICNTVRSCDNKHPLVAGMHGITPQPSTMLTPSGTWSIEDMSDNFDVLTVHPYPLFSPHTPLDRITGIKNIMHAAAEAHFFGDIGRRPCVAEELGTLAPTVAGEESAAQYLNNTIWQLYAHDCEGMYWWCGFDQYELTEPPYQWCGVERCLGLFRNDGSRKKVADVMYDFSNMLEKISIEKLPRFKRDAVCILTEEQDSWMMAYGAWVLAKQAGFDIEFQFADEKLREADFYMVPGIAGLNNMPRDRYMELMEKVYNGASLYMSFDGACLAPFDEYFGLNVDYMENYNGTLQLDLQDEKLDIDFVARLTACPVTAEVLLRDSDGNVFMSRNCYGKGEIYFMTASPERHIVVQNRAMDKAYYKLYRMFSRKITDNRIFSQNDPQITVTLHHENADSVIAVIINNSDIDKAVSGCRTADTWTVVENIYGSMDSIPAHSGCIIRLKR